jgi:hypothetical protein
MCLVPVVFTFRLFNALQICRRHYELFAQRVFARVGVSAVAPPLRFALAPFLSELAGYSRNGSFVRVRRDVTARVRRAFFLRELMKLSQPV